MNSINGKNREVGIPLLVVLSFNVPNPEAVTQLLRTIDPPSLPMFAGQARVVVGDDVADVIEFLDE